MGFVIAFFRPFVWLFCWLCFRIKFRGITNIPPKGACIITPNHSTYADPIWVTIPVRRRIYFMAWDKPFEIPVLGFLMRTFGAFPVKLEAIDSAAQRSAVELLRRGKALVMFPEGGRSKTGQVMPFKMGAFRLALVHGAPIVPVTIEGGHSAWPVGKLLPRFGRVTVTYHPPVPVERVSAGIHRSELKRQARILARRIREITASGIGQVPDQAGEEDVVSLETTNT